MSSQPKSQVQVGTFRKFAYSDLKPNPLNPRRLFDKDPLEVLRDSIRKNGILVPLTVYQEAKTGQYYIIDGERRWPDPRADATPPPTR